MRCVGVASLWLARSLGHFRVHPNSSDPIASTFLLFIQLLYGGSVYFWGLFRFNVRWVFAHNNVVRHLRGSESSGEDPMWGDMRIPDFLISTGLLPSSAVLRLTLVFSDVGCDSWTFSSYVNLCISAELDDLAEDVSSYKNSPLRWV